MPRTYVQFQEASINEQIESQLNQISKIILKNIPNVRSIIITGGFGKGEGSVRVASDGHVKCLRDFDIVCVLDHKPKSRAVDKLEDEIYESLGLENPKSSVYERAQSFVVDLRFLNKNELIYPDIYFYDLKAGSQILWGEDVRGLVPWTKKDVPLSSGLRLLFEKVTGLLGHFSIDFVHGKIPTQVEKELLVSQCRKTFIELGTALCILARKYEPKFAQQAVVLRDHYRIEFPKLAEVLPELPDKVAQYTNLRLNPNLTDVEEDPIELFFSAQSYLKETIRFYIRSCTGKSLTDWTTLPELMRTVARTYYIPFLGPIMRRRFGLSSKSALILAGFLYQGLVNIEYSYVVALNKEGTPIRPLLSWNMSPSLKYFTSGTLLLFSLNRNATVDAGMLEIAEKELRNCVSSRIASFDSRGWEELRMRFLKARSLYKGYHFVK